MATDFAFYPRLMFRRSIKPNDESWEGKYVFDLCRPDQLESILERSEPHNFGLNRSIPMQ